jgi:hypothetical protein
MQRVVMRLKRANGFPQTPLPMAERARFTARLSTDGPAGELSQ